MSKFKRKKEGGVPAISTSALPDIIYMLLFFFMVTTTMKEVEYKVVIKLPGATEVTKLEKKSLVSYIYIGVPNSKKAQALYGTEPRIQLNDVYATTDEIRQFIIAERDAKTESEQSQMTVSLKVDAKTRMGIVTEVKQELRKASALKINYSTRRVANALLD